jgi:hypothetical protein
VKFCGDNVSHELSLSFDVVAGPFLGRPFPTAAGLPSSVPVGRLRPHLLTQHTALGFAQAAERRRHSASGVSPRNRSRDATSRRAATDNATTSCSSFNRALPLLSDA